MKIMSKFISQFWRGKKSRYFFLKKHHISQIIFSYFKKQLKNLSHRKLCSCLIGNLYSSLQMVLLCFKHRLFPAIPPGDIRDWRSSTCKQMLHCWAAVPLQDLRVKCYPAFHHCCIHANGASCVVTCNWGWEQMLLLQGTGNLDSTRKVGWTIPTCG